MTRFVLRYQWSWPDRLVGILVLCVVILHYSLDFVGAAEGRVMPVVRGFTMQQTGAESGEVVVAGAFTITRPACKFRRIEWRLVKAGRDVPVEIELRDGPKVRPGGDNHFENWAIFMNPEDLRDSFVTVYHQCPWRPWLTITQLYP